MSASPPGGGAPGPVDKARPGLPAKATTKGDRVRDVVALVLVLGGIVLVLVSHAGMQRLATQPIVVAKGQAAFSAWNTYAYIELAGWATTVIGIIVGITSYIIHARRGRAARAADRAP